MMLCVTLSGQAPQIPTAIPGQAPPVDLSGYWSPVLHEDLMERGAGSELADYGGFPLNEAGRLWALSYDPSRVTLRHHQCEAYLAPYQMRALGNFRIWEEREEHTQRLVAIHIWAQTTEGHRIVWMDGRPHPPAWAPHTFRGFSTGQFVGNTFVVRTTHMKNGALRRGNGVPQSDQATLTEFFVRHDDHLTNVTVVTDPVFLSEPIVRSNDFYRQPVDPGAWLYACDDGEQILDRAKDDVPHYLFGKQPFAREFAARYKLPLAASLLGGVTMYPELATRLRTVTNVEADALLAPIGGRSPETSKGVDPEPHDGSIHIWPVRDNVYMLIGDGGNIVVQTGDQGAFVVDTGEGNNVRESHRRNSNVDEQAYSVHRQHELPARAHWWQCGTRRRRSGSQPAGIVLPRAVTSRRHGILRRPAQTRNDDGACERASADAGGRRTGGRRFRRIPISTIVVASFTTATRSSCFIRRTPSRTVTVSSTSAARTSSLRATFSRPLNSP